MIESCTPLPLRAPHEETPEGNRTEFRKKASDHFMRSDHTTIRYSYRIFVFFLLLPIIYRKMPFCLCFFHQSSNITCKVDYEYCMEY